MTLQLYQSFNINLFLDFAEIRINIKLNVISYICLGLQNWLVMKHPGNIIICNQIWPNVSLNIGFIFLSSASGTLNILSP